MHTPVLASAISCALRLAHTCEAEGQWQQGAHMAVRLLAARGEHVQGLARAK